MLTCNNYSAHNVSQFDLLSTVYSIRAFEVAPTTGTPHLQGYVYFKNAVSRTGLRKKLPGYFLEIANGTPLQNQTYCKKDGDFLETGKLPAQGVRNDIHGFVLAMSASDEKVTERVLIEEHSQMVARYPMFVDRVQRLYHPPKALTELNNFWYFGVPGAGKSFKAKTHGSFFKKFPNKWHCGYAGEDVIIVEDLEPRHAAFMGHYLKLWADLDPYTAQVKGSSMFIRPKTIIVTTNYGIMDMGWDEITTQAIQRRFQVEYFAEIYANK